MFETEDEEGYNFHFSIFNILNLMVPQITIDSFRVFVIPYILFDFKKLHRDDVESFCKFCISFIYFNQDIEESAQLFEEIFCSSGIFDEIIEKIDMKVEKLLKIIHFNRC